MLARVSRKTDRVSLLFQRKYVIPTSYITCSTLYENELLYKIFLMPILLEKQLDAEQELS